MTASGDVGDLLRRYARSFDAALHLDADPLGLVHRYGDAADQEAVAWIAASMAFGRVGLFRPVVERILGRLDPYPAASLRHIAKRGVDAALDAVSNERYRWLESIDLAVMLLLVGTEIEEFGSLEGSFVAHAGVGPPLDRVARWMGVLRSRATALHPQAADRGRALAFLFPDPDGASACKRQHLFLRWMVRPKDGGGDLGLWRALRPADLLMPCDVHVARIGHALSLCESTEPSRRTAEAITASLRRWDPLDPVRFDFALCHLGISGGCRARYVPEHCTPCPLRGACRWGGLGRLSTPLDPVGGRS